MADDSGLTLMRLYRELREASDPAMKDAIKARIDGIIEEARQTYTPHLVGQSHGASR